jgi:hypothetical protein
MFFLAVGTFVVSALNWLGGLFGFGGGPDIGAIAGQLGQLTRAFNGLVGGLFPLLNDIAGIFQSIWKGLKWLWENYIKVALDWLQKHLAKAIDWIRRHLKSAIAQLKKWKKWYDQHILPQQLRMLKTIQMIRQFLSILRLFHVKWATQLDAKLADIQNRIVTVINLTRGTLNDLINLLAAIYDPRLLFRRNALGAGLLANIGLVKRIAFLGDGRALFASEASAAQAGGNRYLSSTVQSNVAQRNASGLTAQDKQDRKDAQTALHDVTSTPVAF